MEIFSTKDLSHQIVGNSLKLSSLFSQQPEVEGTNVSKSKILITFGKAKLVSG